MLNQQIRQPHCPLLIPGMNLSGQHRHIASLGPTD